MGRGSLGMNISAIGHTGYGKFMFDVERIKNILQVGKEYILYRPYSTRNGKKSILMKRTLVKKYPSYALFKSPTGPCYSYDYRDLVEMTRKPDGEIMEERELYLSAYD